jgi:hypothetical protein
MAHVAPRRNAVDKGVYDPNNGDKKHTGGKIGSGVKGAKGEASETGV